MREYLYHDDLAYRLACLIDEKACKSPLVHDEFMAFMQHCRTSTRPGVLSTAISFFKALGSGSVARCLEDSTISLVDIVSGETLDIFITVPPEKLRSHRSLIRVWMGTLLTAVMHRKSIPKQQTLFVLDEAAQLGTFDPLLTAATLLRGYGLQLVTVWQDLAQMKCRYPQDWATILNNSGALLAFGMGHYSAAKKYADVLGLDARELASLRADEAALAIRGEGTRKIIRLNYLKDAQFAGLADPNPYFGKGRGI